MIRSMTGFGSASVELDGAHYSVEIRSLNNKYFKSQIRLPEEIQALEADLEAALVRHLTRGTVILTVRYTDMSANAAARINTRALQRYLDQLLAVPGLNNNSTTINLGDLIMLPGVMAIEPEEARVKEARVVLLRLVDEACVRLIAMRTREGETLHVELHKHRGQIAEHLRVLSARSPEIVELYQQRLRDRMELLMAESGLAVREEDLIREVAIFAEKSDIAEEVSRLHGHLDQFAEIIDHESPEPSGRTLDFLAQEMLREANTIGSKCLDVQISKRIVEIKGAIDRIKEQVQNVE